MVLFLSILSGSKPVRSLFSVYKQMGVSLSPPPLSQGWADVYTAIVTFLLQGYLLIPLHHVCTNDPIISSSVKRHLLVAYSRRWLGLHFWSHPMHCKTCWKAVIHSSCLWIFLPSFLPRNQSIKLPWLHGNQCHSWEICRDLLSLLFWAFVGPPSRGRNYKRKEW